MIYFYQHCQKSLSLLIHSDIEDISSSVSILSPQTLSIFHSFGLPHKESMSINFALFIQINTFRGTLYFILSSAIDKPNR
mmetsp:Transcript_33492/g.40133  ORF Transcript_33492/g.40133 Transcript_33492/m.40133 type:complete len:80 (+) Transcript_33492:243-482(+)